MVHLRILEQIIKFADQAHGNQLRKYSSDRYIVHPVRVMKVCNAYTDQLPVLAAAILHDVIEDTPYTRHDIDQFLLQYMNVEDCNRTTCLVMELTDVYVKKNYPSLNRSARKKKEISRLKTISSDAQTIKYADIMDNAQEISQSDPEFSQRYLNECHAILSALPDGNAELRKIAIHVITEQLNRLP